MGNTPANPPKIPLWQWFFLYPTFGIALIGSLPTAINLIQSVRLGVSTNKVSIAEEQNELWEKNLECIRSKKPAEITTEAKKQVKILVCPSGDFYVEVYDVRTEEYTARWFGKSLYEKDSDKKSDTAMINFLISPLLAEQQEQTEKVCSIEKSSNSMKRIVKKNRKCYVQFIDTYTNRFRQFEIQCPVDC